MELPPELFVNQITTCCIFHFKNNNLPREIPCHYHVVMPLSNGNYIVCLISSKVKERKRVWELDQKALDSLIILDNNTLTCLTKESVIDCNRAELLTKQELTDRIDTSQLSATKVINPTIPLNLKHHMIASIQNSPIVKLNIKKSLSLVI